MYIYIYLYFFFQMVAAMVFLGVPFTCESGKLGSFIAAEEMLHDMELGVQVGPPDPRCWA